METVFCQCKIIDGTGSPWFRGDVGVTAGKIERIGDLSAVKTKHRIDAGGHVLCPGFIDIHSHDDVSVVYNRRAQVKVHQGITTQVVGNCGHSAAPVRAESLPDLRKTMYLIDPDPEFTWNWQSMEDYFAVVDSEGTSCNVIGLVGHINLRATHVGYEDRPATPVEVAAMKDAVAQAMSEGAAGLSTGMIYAPGRYGTTEELIALCETVREKDGLYATHMRGYDDRLLDSVRETIEIGEQSGVPVQISHHVSVGQQNWQMMSQSFDLIEAARKRGVDVTVDVYPYPAGSANLSQLIGGWAHEGGVDRLVDRVKSLEARERVRQEWRERPYWAPEDIMVSSVTTTANETYVGKRLGEVAQARGQDVIDVLCDLVIEEHNNVNMVAFVQLEDNVRMNLRHPLTVLGTDGLPIKEFGHGHPHPRAYAAFPRLLAKFVREENLLTLEEALRKMTSFPARKAGLRDRGIIREGMVADLVIFDLEALQEEATFTEPHHYPTGLDYVVVNGKIVVDHGAHTGAQPGGAIRMGS